MVNFYGNAAIHNRQATELFIRIFRCTSEGWWIFMFVSLSQMQVIKIKRIYSASKFILLAFHIY